MKQKPKIIRRLTGVTAGLQLNQVWAGRHFIGFDRYDWEQPSNRRVLRSRYRRHES